MASITQDENFSDESIFLWGEHGHELSTEGSEPAGQGMVGKVRLLFGKPASSADGDVPHYRKTFTLLGTVDGITWTSVPTGVTVFTISPNAAFTKSLEATLPFRTCPNSQISWKFDPARKNPY